MIYGVEDTILHDNMGEYAEGLKKVESLLREFCKANPTSHSACESDNEGRFLRAFLSHPFVLRHEIHGQKILCIDGTFMKQGMYRETMLAVDWFSLLVIVCHSRETLQVQCVCAVFRSHPFANGSCANLTL